MQEREEENQQGEEEITYKELQNVIKKTKTKKKAQDQTAYQMKSS